MGSLSRKIRRVTGDVKNAKAARAAARAKVREARHERKAKYERGELPKCGGHERSAA